MKHLQKLGWFRRFHGCGSKIRPATLICILKSKWPYLAWFWSYKNIWKIIFHKKNNFSLVLLYTFLLLPEPFVNYCQKRTIAFAFYHLSCQILAYSDSLGVENKRDFAFLTITQKWLIWEQKLVKFTHTEIIFWWKNIIEVFL